MVDTEILCFLEKVRLAPRFADTEILCFLEKVRSTPRFADTEILYFLKKVRSRQIPPYSNSGVRLSQRVDASILGDHWTSPVTGSGDLEVTVFVDWITDARDTKLISACA